MRTITFIVLVLVGFVQMQAQNNELSGTITDRANTPIPGAEIHIDELNRGKISNEDGVFKFSELPEGTYDLQISFIGFKSKRVTFSITENEILSLDKIILYEGNEILNEVVITKERHNKFSRKQTAYVSKLPLRDIENTQVYSTVTNELLESQVVTNFEDALKNAVGVEKLWSSTGRGGDGAGYYSLRGFSVQPQLVNGLPGITNGTINPANIERIEVIKGPSATLFGNAVTSYGGLINVVTKKPYAGKGGEVSFSTGSYGLNQVNADINTPLDDDENIYFRLNTSYTKEQSFQDAGFRETFFVAPSLSYKVNEKLSFSFYGEITQAEQTNPMLLFLNRSAPSAASTIDELNYNYDLSFTSNDLTLKNPTQNYRVEMDYKLSDSWNSQTLVSRSSTSTKGYYSYLFDYGVFDGNAFTRLISKQNSNTQTTDIQQNFNGDFLVGDIRNRMVIGLDYFTSTETSNNSGYATYGNVRPDGTFIADDPFTEEIEEGIYPLSTAGVDQALANQPVGNNKARYHIYSAYVSDVINFTNKFSAMLGLRLDHFNNEGDVLNPEDDFNQTTLSPKFGLMYQPIKNKLSVFANYQNGFTNVAPRFVGNPDEGAQTLETFTPEQANQFELGVKTNMFDDRLNATLNFYDIRVKDQVITDPSSPFNFIQGGEVESRGAEFELNANPINGLNIRAGYSYNESETTKTDNTEILGRRPLEAGPKTLYNFWSTYQFQEGKLKGFGVGAGLNGASEAYAINYASTGDFMLPAYTIANTSVFYQANKYRISLKVNNFLNDKYYKGWTTISPQMPRQVIANFTYKF
ncbi:MAG: TonB-dependent siderophore receptor [Bacteroidota bacterium]